MTVQANKNIALFHQLHNINQSIIDLLNNW